MDMYVRRDLPNDVRATSIQPTSIGVRLWVIEWSLNCPSLKAMTTTSEQRVRNLNKLIQVCRDGELGYRKAARNVSSSKLRTILVDYAIRRSQFAQELRAEVERQGESAPDSGSLAA